MYRFFSSRRLPGRVLEWLIKLAYSVWNNELKLLLLAGARVIDTCCAFVFQCALCFSIFFFLSLPNCLYVSPFHSIPFLLFLIKDKKCHLLLMMLLMKKKRGVAFSLWQRFPPINSLQLKSKKNTLPEECFA